MEQGINSGAEPSLDEIRAGLSGREPRPAYEPRQKKSRPQKSRREYEPSGPKQPTAPPMPSLIAQQWFDLGNQHGWEFPYNVNFLALAIAERVERDKFLVAVRTKQNEHQVQRILEKMVQVWWRDYINGEVTRRNAKEMFLDEDWDDVRYYAHTSLRAAYLKKHGKRKPIKALMDEAQADFGRDLHERLKALRLNQRIEDILAQPEIDRTPLDEAARERLRSFREKHGGKK